LDLEKTFDVLTVVLYYQNCNFIGITDKEYTVIKS